MKKKDSDITIFAIGDRVDWESYERFNRTKAFFNHHGFDYVTTDYRNVLVEKIPHIKTERVAIFLFFPFNYWNRDIEYKNYKGMYGCVLFQKKFARFWKSVEKILRRNLSDKKIHFINKPELCGLYRDKLSVSKILSKARITTPKIYNISSLHRIQELLSNGHKLFIKPRCGSMGKGITYLSPDNWQTNFIFRNGEIRNRVSDYGWKFIDVTGNIRFLGKLLKEDVLIQEAVIPPLFEGNIVDLRVYAFLNKALYIFPRKNRADKITTNVSQGGKGDDTLLRIIPKNLLSKVKRTAEKSLKILNLGFGGIDIFLDKNLKDVYVIEVNLFPGFTKNKRFDIPEAVVGELAKRRDNIVFN